MPIDTPHFAFPFRINAGKVQVREQDSDEEVMDCVEVLLSTTIGERQELPNYGIPDQTFRMGGSDKAALLAAIREHEPRADVNFEQTDLEGLIETVRVSVRGHDA
jgi:phage baseplate assembly protein W